MTDEATLRRQSAHHKKTGFDEWLSQPSTRLIVSMIPAGDKDDALRMLLQSAFEQGFNCGATTTMIEVLKHMTMGDKKQGD